MSADIATSHSASTARSRRRWLLRSAVATLASLSMIGGISPAIANPPTPAPKADPARPSTGHAPTSGLTRPPTRPNNPRLVGDLLPANDALVGGKSLEVQIPVERGSKLDVARLDHRPINRYLERRGNLYIGQVPNVAVGLMHLNVTVVKGKTEARVNSRFTVQGKRADLLSPLAPTSGKLAAATAPGVAPVSVKAHPRARVFATVNGRRVDDDLLGRPEVGGTRRFVASASDGLRRGRNVVETTAYLADGRWESVRSIVTVPADSPLAEAGTPRRQSQGSTVNLDGARSSASTNRHRLSYSWRLVSAPAGSNPIATPKARTATLRLSQPGDHVVALTVTETVAGKRRTSTDVTTISSIKAEPAIGARLETLVTNVDKLPPAKEGAATDGIGMVFDGRFRSFAVDFTDRSGRQDPAGLYRIDPQSLAVIPVRLAGTDLDGAVEAALDQAAQGDILVLQVRADADITSKYLAGGPYSRVVAYDGQGATNFWSDGATNAGLRLGASDNDLDPAGSLSGYLRVVVDSAQAKIDFRFVRDSGRITYSTSVPHTATTGPDGGAIYRLVSATSGQAVTATTGAPTESSVRVKDVGTDLSQQWQLVPVYGQLYKLVDQWSRRRCLDATEAVVTAAPCDQHGPDQPSQLWSPQYDQVRRAYRLVPATAPNDYAGHGGQDETGYLSVGVDGTLTRGSTSDQYWYFDIPPGIYTVRVGSGSNTQVGKALTEPDYGTEANTQLKVTTDTGELTQRWQVVDGPRHAGQPQQFSLVNLGSGMCADVPGGNKQDNGPVNRYTCHPVGGDPTKGNQQWTPIATGSGLELHSVATGEALAADPNGNVVQQELDDQAPVKQVWSLRRTLPAGIGDTLPLALADRSGRSLQLSGNELTGAKTTTPSVSNTWTLGDQGNNHVQIRNLDGRTCIDPYAAEDGSGHKLPQARPCTDSGFLLRYGSDGTLTFSTEDGALVIDADGKLSIQTGAPGTPFIPTGFGGTMQVGRSQYQSTASAGQSGFWVMAFDQSLKPQPDYPKTYVTSGLPAGGAQGQGAQDLATDLSALSKVDHVTVLAQSFGRPHPTDGSWNDLRSALDNLGVDGRSVLQLDRTGDFAAAGCTGCDDSPVDNGATNPAGGLLRGDARLTGHLGWTSTSTRAPLTGTSVTVQPGLSALADRSRNVDWPFSGRNADHQQSVAVNAIYEQLGSWPDACQEPNADPIRNSYCAQDAAEWGSRINNLEGITYEQAKQSANTLDEPSFNTVKHTLLREFSEVQLVHSLFSDVTSLLEQNFIAGQVVIGPNSAASRINDVIYQPKGPTPTTPNNPANVGGVLSTIGDAMIVLKDIIEVGGIVLADKRPRLGGTTDEPEPGLAGSSWSLLADGFLLFADAVDEAGAADDGSARLGLDINAPLHDYASQLNAQMVNAIDNLSTVRAIVLADPVTLSAAAMNRTYGPWQLSPDQRNAMISAFTAGVVRDLWPRQLGAGYQLLRWPRLPDGYDVLDIRAPDDGDLGYHQLYEGQPVNASVYPVEKVGAGGAASSIGTYTITRMVPGSLLPDRDRIIRGSIITPFYQQTGIKPYDLPGLSPLRNANCVDWPFWLESDSNETGIQKPGGSYTDFGPNAKDWDSTTTCIR